MADQRFPAAPSPLRAALGNHCPRCGKGPMFAGFLEPVQRCDRCGLEIAALETGDGPAVFVILLVGAVVVGLALLVEVAWRPPIWLHMSLWIPLTLALALGLLRPLKGVMLALGHRSRADRRRAP